MSETTARATKDAPGTLIRVDHGTRQTWHHSVAFDGYTHGTACGQAVDCDEFDELRMDLSDWSDFDPQECCDECAGSVRSLCPELDRDGDRE